MKVSINLAQYYSNVDIKSIKHEVILEKIGSQLGAVEEYFDFAPKYKDVVVAKIVKCSDHPNADRLHVCMIDDGGVTKSVERNEDGLVQVVCGAPNAREGIYVAWLAPGSTVPSSMNDDEPFVLSARELRGVVSNGMLASPKELDINDDHDGILELNPEEIGHEPKAGEALTKYFGLDDFVVDCENKMFTHRPDCFGNLGVARELAGINGLKFKSPDWYLSTPKFETKTGLKLQPKNQIPKLVKRFMAVAMDNVHVHKSPIWLQAALTRVGLKPINNVVDITNFVMHLTGQPLHAFDYDKLNSQQLGPRMAKKGEKLALLNGKTVELTEDDMVIATDEKAVALAGIMGGSETEVDEHTTRIVIEAATFDMYTVRRTCMRQGIFTDASTRFTKNQSHLQNDRAIWFAIEKMQEMASAKQASNVYDLHNSLDLPNDVVVSAQFVNERLGTSLTIKEIGALLEKVEFEVLSVPADKNHLHIRPPFWRTDIEIPEDIVEEVGRLYGYDKVNMQLPNRSTRPVERDEQIAFKMHLRYMLKELGANEVLTYSFVNGKLLKNVGQDPEQAYHIRNALSPDLQYYRLSVLPSLLDKVQLNIRSDMVRTDDNSFAIFEIGKGHMKDWLDIEEDVPRESDSLALVFAADEKTAARNYVGSPYYQAKHYLESLLKNCSNHIKYETIPYDTTDDYSLQMSKPFDPNRSAAVKVDGITIGYVGEIKPEIKQKLKLPEFTAGFELYLRGLQMLKNNTYQPLSSFPKIQQDITLEVKDELTFGRVLDDLEESLKEITSQKDLQVKIAPRDIFKPENEEVTRLTFRIWMISSNRTMTIDESNLIIDKAVSRLGELCGAVRI